MPIIVKPISANLTKDSDWLGKMVKTCLFRIPMLYALLDNKNKGLKLIQEEEKALNGLIL